MKATGIVRRLDDLGRIVIPKEVRQTLNIKAGAPLELFISKAGDIVFRKYTPLGEKDWDNGYRVAKALLQSTEFGLYNFLESKQRGSAACPPSCAEYAREAFTLHEIYNKEEDDLYGYLMVSNTVEEDKIHLTVAILRAIFEEED